ncbi:MAG: DUF1934 domain-containing protein [Eubacteriales bacterium]|nr:DUF1934 domain-containing protein [Eubacteriales bacterium]
MTNILVTIRGVQEWEGEDVIHLVMPGTLHIDNTGSYITYDETEETGMAGTTTTICVKGKKVEIIRTGTSKSVITLERGKRYDCEYQTPHGAMSISTIASEVKAYIGDSEGKVRAKYMITIGNQPSGENIFDISYKVV